ncbi:hypothetical protein AHF37_05219 [Paragonimus kellicotti]|nr:hypothetical protein AHF37_05219 [Paragonimus kellicotti]
MAPARLSIPLLGVILEGKETYSVNQVSQSSQVCSRLVSILFTSAVDLLGAQAANSSPQQQQPASTFVVKCSIPPEQAVEFTHLNPKFRRKPFTEEEVAIYQSAGLDP